MENSASNSTVNEVDDVNNKDEFTLDMILIRIGQFGKFQLMVFFMICIPMMFNAIFSVAFVFTASSVVHSILFNCFGGIIVIFMVHFILAFHIEDFLFLIFLGIFFCYNKCNISECDSSTSAYDEPWTEFSIPMKGQNLDQCQRYESYLSENSTALESNEREFCFSENFNRDVDFKCPENEFIFRDKEVTISNEFGIYCSDEWKLSLVGTLNNIGQFVGIPIGGLVSDRYGRSTSLALGGLISSIFGFIRSFSPSYAFFLVFEFLDNVACSTLYSTCFIVGIELVGPKRRVIACSIITIFYAVGEIALALVAKYYQNWRVLLRVIYVPALVHLAYFWLLPESVRWLLSQGKEDQATDLLKRAAAVNNRRLSDHSLDKLVLANRNKLERVNESKFPIKSAFSTLFWRIINCSFCWIVNTLVYYGLSLNAVLLGGDKYNNFIFIALIEIPGFLLPYLTMDRLGRRYSLFGYMVISGLCCLVTIFIHPDQFYWHLSFFLVGKMTITASFQVLYFFTSEIFPTNVRNSLLSFCSMVGRLGSMLAPQTPLLAKYYENAPAILFASTAIISGFLSLLFPETTNIILPTTMQEADNIGVKVKKDKTISVSTQL